MFDANVNRNRVAVPNKLDLERVYSLLIICNIFVCVYSLEITTKKKCASTKIKKNPLVFNVRIESRLTLLMIYNQILVNNHENTIFSFFFKNFIKIRMY